MNEPDAASRPAPAPQSESAGADIPAKFETPAESWDFIRREAMIPMRDGVKLHTVIVLPRKAKDAPILLTRTPFGA